MTKRITDVLEKQPKGSIYIIENYHGYTFHWKPNGEQRLIKPTNWDFIITKVINSIKKESKLIETGQYFDIYEKL